MGEGAEVEGGTQLKKREGQREMHTSGTLRVFCLSLSPGRVSRSRCQGPEFLRSAETVLMAQLKLQDEFAPVEQG